MLEFELTYNGLGDALSDLELGDVRVMGVGFAPDVVTVTPQSDAAFNTTFTYNMDTGVSANTSL